MNEWESLECMYESSTPLDVVAWQSNGVFPDDEEQRGAGNSCSMSPMLSDVSEQMVVFTFYGRHCNERTDSSGRTDQPTSVYFYSNAIMMMTALRNALIE